MSVKRIVFSERAVGKPRMTQQDKWKQRPVVVQYRKWCDRLRKAVGPVPEASKILRLDWTATFVPPPSWSKGKKLTHVGQLHRQIPDRDNIDKAILDTLWKRDSGIAFGTIKKVWGEMDQLEIVIEYEDV